jgi:hypothetical protein
MWRNHGANTLTGRTRKNRDVDLPPGQVTRADVLIEQSLAMLAPLVRLLVASGVTYPQFTTALKLAFLRAAHAELSSGEKRITDSAISLLSGVHRKDVRALAADGALPARLADRAASLPDEVFMRWTNDPQFLDVDGLPKVLPLRSRAGETSFETLAQSVSRDFHARSVLEELVRLGLVEESGETVRLKTTSFVPHNDLAEALAFMAAAVGDHIAASAENIRAIQTEATPAFLEQSIYADELSAESIVELHRLARRIWESALRRMFALANDRTAIDRNNALVEQTLRMRFGVYFYSETATPVATQGDLAIAATKDAP